MESRVGEILLRLLAGVLALSWLMLYVAISVLAVAAVISLEAPTLILAGVMGLESVIVTGSPQQADRRCDTGTLINWALVIALRGATSTPLHEGWSHD